MLNFRVAVLTGVIALAASIPGRADYLAGTQVTGSITFGTGTVNYYDPAKGYVPPGDLNALLGTTVTINPVAGVTEFGFADGHNTDTADFTDGTLTITDIVASGSKSNSWTQTFTDAAFQFGAIVKTSDTFGYGGLTADLNTTNHTLTISWAGTGVDTLSTKTAYTAQFNITDPQPVSTPEPSSLALLAVALGGLAIAGRKHKRAGA